MYTHAHLDTLPKPSGSRSKPLKIQTEKETRNHHQKKNAQHGCCRHTIQNKITAIFVASGLEMVGHTTTTPPQHLHRRHRQAPPTTEPVDGSGTLRKRHKSNDSISRTPASREGVKASIRELFFAQNERDTHTSTSEKDYRELKQKKSLGQLSFLGNRIGKPPRLKTNTYV